MKNIVMKKNRIGLILSMLTLLMTSCDGDVVVLPLWLVVAVAVCFCIGSR